MPPVSPSDEDKCTGGRPQSASWADVSKSKSTGHTHAQNWEKIQKHRTVGKDAKTRQQ